MNKNDFITLITQLPDGVDITVQTCSYDGNSDIYDDQEPRFVTNNNYAILTGTDDFYAQSKAARELSGLDSTAIGHRLAPICDIVRVE